MFQRFLYGSSNQRMHSHHPVNTSNDPQQSIVRGKIVSARNSAGIVFHGNEILEVSAVDASLMDAPSTLLGRQRIPLQSGQQFPIRFQFAYDGSRAGQSYGGLIMQARITNRKGQLMYINDTHIPVKDNVNVDVIRV